MKTTWISFQKKNAAISCYESEEKYKNRRNCKKVFVFQGLQMS